MNFVCVCVCVCLCMYLPHAILSYGCIHVFTAKVKAQNKSFIPIRIPHVALLVTPTLLLSP